MKVSMGIGRLLIAVYGVFAVSATARASYQLVTEFDQAPVAYSLSAVSAVVYVIAAIALARGQKSMALAKFAVAFELIGVIVVGILSLLLPELFSHPSVWSGFGIGYAFIPMLLPILGLIWLRRQSARA